jgi:hypothetical protein
MFRLNMYDLEAQQERLIDLLKCADEIGAITLKSMPNSPVAQRFVELFTMGSQEALTRRELTDLTLLAQTFVRMPVYTPEQASGWLGEGLDRVRDGVWRNGKLRSYQPGRKQRLILHKWLVEYQNNGNGC